MGIYHDTIRSETRIIDGVEIGRYSFAYKESSSQSWFPGSGSRKVSSAESRAEDAQYKNRKVRFFIMADSFKVAAEEDGYYVFELPKDREMPPLSTSGTVGEVVGQIRKVGRKYVFIRQHKAVARVALAA